MRSENASRRLEPWKSQNAEDRGWGKAFGLGLILGGLISGCAVTNATDSAENYPYIQPLSSPGTKFGGLPPAAQKTVRAQAGAADIRDIVKTSRSGEVVYRVTFLDGKTFPPLYVKPDGTVLYPDLTVAVGAPHLDDIGMVSGGQMSGLALGDLPKNAAQTVQSVAPAAEPAHIRKFTLGSQVYYEISFKESANHPTLRVAEDGTLIEQTGH